MKKSIRHVGVPLAMATPTCGCVTPMQYDSDGYKLDERTAVMHSCGEQAAARVCAQSVLHSYDVTPGAPRSVQSDTGGKRI